MMKQEVVGGEVRGKEDGDWAGKALLHIVGKNEFNNEILADYIREHTGIACRHLKNHGFNEEIERFTDRINLILMDYTSLKGLNAGEIASLEVATQAPNCMLVLFRVNPARKAEQKLFSRGARGILYDGQPISMFPKALLGVLGGELWYPRRILEQFFLQKDIPQFIPNPIWYKLTARQRQILQMLTAGKSNQEIAASLNLSTHTIKTHIYNIYKKLGVRNRLQASAMLSE